MNPIPIAFFAIGLTPCCFAQGYSFQAIAETGDTLTGTAGEYTFDYFTREPSWNDGGDVVFQCRLFGPTVTASHNNDFFIVRKSGLAPEIILQERDLVTSLNDEYKYLSLDDIQIGAGGHIGFICSIQEVDSFASYPSVFLVPPGGMPEAQLRSHFPQPGLPVDVTAGEPIRFALNDAGDMAIEALTLGDNVTPGFDAALFVSHNGSTPAAIARDSTYEGDVPGNLLYRSVRQNRLSWSNGGTLAYQALFSGSSPEIGALRYVPGIGISSIVLDADPIDAIGLGFSFDLIYYANTNESGNTVFEAGINHPNIDPPERDSGLFVATENGIEIVALEGQPAPGFSGEELFGEFISNGSSHVRNVINSNGDIAFLGRVTNPAPINTIGWGLFLKRVGQPVELLVGPGDPVPGLPGSVFSGSGSRIQINDQCDVFLHTQISTSTSGLFMARPNQPVKTILILGEPITLEDGSQKIVESFKARNEPMNDHGQVVVLCTFDDGTQGIYIASPIPCLADTNHDGTLSPADFTAWIAAFNAQAPECDQNGDGSCTPADFTAWIANYNAGC